MNKDEAMVLIAEEILKSMRELVGEVGCVASELASIKDELEGIKYASGELYEIRASIGSVSFQLEEKLHNIACMIDLK